jgi:hypothetical protein
MLLLQCEIDTYSSQSFFQNIYEGTLWWKEHYSNLPENTRICLESILSDGYIGHQMMDGFGYKEALQAGYACYMDVLENHPVQGAVGKKTGSGKRQEEGKGRFLV